MMGNSRRFARFGCDEKTVFPPVPSLPKYLGKPRPTDPSAELRDLECAAPTAPESKVVPSGHLTPLMAARSRRMLASPGRGEAVAAAARARMMVVLKSKIMLGELVLLEEEELVMGLESEIRGR